MKTDLVVAGCIFHNSKVLLIHHRKLDLWLPVGGHIEKDETPDDAVKREAKEEVGIGVDIIKNNDLPFEGNIKKNLAVPFHVNVHSAGDHDHCCLFYACTAKDIDINPNGKELKDFGWFSKDDLNQNHVPLDVKHIALKAFGIYNDYCKDLKK